MVNCSDSCPCSSRHEVLTISSRMHSLANPMKDACTHVRVSKYRSFNLNFSNLSKNKLENVAINDVLPLKATRHYAIANVKWFWRPRTPETSFRWFHLHSLCGATLLGSHQRYLPPSVWQSLVGFRLLTSVFNAWQRSITPNLRRVLENSGPILNRLQTKVHEILGQCRRPFVLSDALALPNCLCPVLFRRYSPLSLEVVENRTNVKSFFRGTTPTILRQIVCAIYRSLFGKVWSSSVWWQWSRMQNLQRVDKNDGPILSRLWTKVHDISHDVVGNPIGPL